MTKNSKYDFLKDFVGLKIKVGIGVDLYTVLADHFLPYIGDAGDETNRAKAGQWAYRVMRGLADNGFDYNSILQTMSSLEFDKGAKVVLESKEGKKKVVGIG